MVHMRIWKMKNRLCMYQRWKQLRLIKQETHHALADGTVELLDTVKYRNLLPGRNYTLHQNSREKKKREIR